MIPQKRVLLVRVVVEVDGLYRTVTSPSPVSDWWWFELSHLRSVAVTVGTGAVLPWFTGRVYAEGRGCMKTVTAATAALALFGTSFPRFASFPVRCCPRADSSRANYRTCAPGRDSLNTIV